MSARDNFTKGTIEKIAGRVNFLCSKPECGALTRGPHTQTDKVINLGEAAHITAAAPGGPRYDASLTKQQRKHPSNGIWLCRPHAKLVDADDSRFTVEDLREWRRLAEERVFHALASRSGLVEGTSQSAGANVEAISFLLGLAKENLSGFLRAESWPDHAVDLKLTLVGSEKQPFDVRGLAATIETFNEIAIIAQPGTGKTTTLVQLASAVVEQGSIVSFFIPLSEWATGTDSFLQSLLNRRSFRQAKIAQLELLAQHGKMLLLLDGWNELDEQSRKRARVQVTELQRDFPDIRIVISSRFAEFDLPVSAPVVKLHALTEDQQKEIATKLRGSDGESLLDHAWRTPGLLELVAIPLYLSVLLKHIPGNSLPTTREELLRMFARQHEQARDKAEILRLELQNLHAHFLGAIAAEATSQETTALSETNARAVVSAIQERLISEGQITAVIPPLKVLDALTSSHLLVRSGSSIAFQHQQFQEWYASFWVEELIYASSGSDISAKRTLRKDVLDLPFWEEPVLFACERISRSGDGGARAVAAVVVETLGIDPLLSAEIIYRSSESTWQLVKEKALEFGNKWHAEKRVDRAVQFMINTGRAEFSEHIWPLISDPNSQVHLRALRSGKRFRPGVLGANPRSRIASLSEELRAHIISEIASEGGMDGIVLATEIASLDSSIRVKTAVIESLQFRRADRFVAVLLRDAPDAVWQSLARKWDADEFGDPAIRKRIQREAQDQVEKRESPSQGIERLLRAKIRSPDIGAKVRDLLKEIDFSDKKTDNAWIAHRAHEAYPNEAVDGLLAQLEAGRPLPFRSDELLREAGRDIDEGLIPQRVLQSTKEDQDIELAASVIGPRTIGQLIDKTIELDPQIARAEGEVRNSLSKEHYRLSDLISKSRSGAFAIAILERSKTRDERIISLLADLISRHGLRVERESLILADNIREQLASALIEWGEILLASKDSTRAQMAEIPQAAERIRSPALVPVLHRLMLEDATRRKKQSEDWLAARKQGRHIDNGASMRWSLQYQRAFAAIGDDQTIALMKSDLSGMEFGSEAAYVLRSIWHDSLMRKEDDDQGVLRTYPDFSVVRDRYAARKSEEKIATFSFVDDILAVVNKLRQSASVDDQKHALVLAKVAFSMPYEGKGDVIAALLQLPLPASNKRDLLTILALSGQTLPSKLVLDGIDELFEEAKTKRWLLDQNNSWLLKEWLRLLPFTDKPVVVMGVLARLEDWRKTPWEMREVLSALGFSPSSEAENILGALARGDERFLKEHDWLAALSKRETIEAGRILLGLVVNATSVDKTGRADKTDIGRRLASFMDAHGQFRAEVYAEYQKLPDGVSKSVLEYAIAEATDMEGVLVLARDAAARKKTIRSTGLYTALRSLLIGKRPSTTWIGNDEMFGLPAADLRKSLFDLLVNGTADESRLASECLVAIDEIRDDYGYADSEPRHPNIQSEVPWPQI
jgi:hypothetical protein